MDTSDFSEQDSIRFIEPPNRVCDGDIGNYEGYYCGIDPISHDQLNTLRKNVLIGIDREYTHTLWVNFIECGRYPIGYVTCIKPHDEDIFRFMRIRLKVKKMAYPAMYYGVVENKKIYLYRTSFISKGRELLATAEINDEQVVERIKYMLLGKNYSPPKITTHDND